MEENEKNKNQRKIEDTKETKGETDKQTIAEK